MSDSPGHARHSVHLYSTAGTVPKVNRSKLQASACVCVKRIPESEMWAKARKYYLMLQVHLVVYTWLVAFSLGSTGISTNTFPRTCSCTDAQLDA